MRSIPAPPPGGKRRCDVVPLARLVEAGIPARLVAQLPIPTYGPAGGEFFLAEDLAEWLPWLANKAGAEGPSC
jgi:hypothetical protein